MQPYEQPSTFQKQICAYILQYVEAEQWPPSIREIGNHIGIKSVGHVWYHLERLIYLGCLERKPGGFRCIRLTVEGKRIAREFIPEKVA